MSNETLNTIEGQMDIHDDDPVASMQNGPRRVNIRCKNVFKIFRQGKLEVVALKGINLDIYAGEIVVIMGPSGSGKTTLLNCMSGMDQASAGNIFIRGYDITRMKDEGIQKILQNEIGIVFQFFNLIPSLTAEGNIELPMTIAKKGTNYKKQKVAQLVEEIGLKGREHHRPFTLSGGQKQRVAIAMAFANDPTIILADEPTGNIDSVSSEKIMQIFQDFITKNPDKSIIIVTHNPSMRKIADRTLIIKDGEIIRELGKVDDSEVNGNFENGTVMEESDKLVYINGKKDMVENIINPDFRYKDYDELTRCPKCDGVNVIKSYDQEDGIFKVKNNQLITKISLFCQDCYQIYLLWAAIKNLREDL